VFEKDVEDSVKGNDVLGVDRGIRKIAVGSDNRFFGGGKVRRVSNRYQKLRSQLQARKTKSAKRHLRRISKKENRFRSDVNHCIAKQIVAPLAKGTTIVLEDLTNIRDNSKKFRKEQKAEINAWSFYQLEMFLKYKAEGKGCFLDYVDARYTSMKCSKCGHIHKGNRKSQSLFICEVCGFTLHADLNASRNIKQNYQDATSSPDWATSKSLSQVLSGGNSREALASRHALADGN
jgi:IS605 OrfB family transposase